MDIYICPFSLCVLCILRVLRISILQSIWQLQHMKYSLFDFNPINTLFNIQIQSGNN